MSTNPTPLLDAAILDGGAPHPLRLRFGLPTVWRWRTLLWVLAAWTLVGFFRAADRYFSDPFQRQRLEFGLWEALAQSLLASYIWAAMTPAVVVLAKHSLPTRANWAAPLTRLFAVGLALGDPPGGLPAPLPAPDGFPHVCSSAQ
jgi:hypothetical protein